MFPLINSEMKVNEGKFKTPMVFGDGFTHVTKYRDIEYAIQQDLDKWLCNMYFEIEPLKMYDVRVDLKHKIILYKKPWIQRIKEALDEELKHERESLGQTGKRSVNQLSFAKNEDSKSVKNLISSFKERDDKSLHHFDEQRFSKQETNVLQSFIDHETD